MVPGHAGGGHMLHGVWQQGSAGILAGLPRRNVPQHAIFVLFMVRDYQL